MFAKFLFQTYLLIPPSKLVLLCMSVYLTYCPFIIQKTTTSIKELMKKIRDSVYLKRTITLSCVCVCVYVYVYVCLCCIVLYCFLACPATNLQSTTRREESVERQGKEAHLTGLIYINKIPVAPEGLAQYNLPRVEFRLRQDRCEVGMDNKLFTPPGFFFTSRELPAGAYD